MRRGQKRGVLLVLMGLCMVLAATEIRYAQEKEDAMAGEGAKLLLRQLEFSCSEQTKTESAADGKNVGEPAMPAIEYMGYAMIGTVRVPSVGIELPVLSDWDYELLKIAPCRYAGSLSEGNLILMGHNYKSHFTPLHQIEEGAEVEFEDVNGAVYRYRVEEIVYLHKSEVEKLDSSYPLTLFTCTSGGQSRIVVRCA